MTLIVENGTGVNGANSLVTVAEADTLLSARGYSVPTEGQLILAMDALAVLNYRGDQFSAGQGLPFPRVDMTRDDGTAMDAAAAFSVMKNAQIWMAHYVVQGFDVMAVASPVVKRQKVDVIEREFAVKEGDSTGISVGDLPMVSALISPLLRGDLTDSSTNTDVMVQGRAYRA